MMAPAAAGKVCRSKLIQAATEAFLSEGYRASVDSIAARAGVAKQTLYNNFTNKEELFAEVGQRLADSITVDLAVGGGDLRSTLIRFALTMREKILSDEEIGVFTSFVAEAPRMPELKALKKRAHDALFSRLTPLIAESMTQGLLRRDDAEFATEMLIGMLLDADRHRRLLGQAFIAGDAEQQRAAKIIDCFLRAFQA